MKNIIILLSTFAAVLVIANIEPAFVGNIILNPICSERATEVYRCFQGNIIQNQIIRSNCAEEWNSLAVCDGICVLQGKNRPVCKKIYAEPTFEQGSFRLGTSKIVVLDFSEKLFEPQGSRRSDITIKNYDTSIMLRGGASAKVKIVNKPFSEITYADCAEGGAYGQAHLLSGQSACIETKEGSMGVIGGTWSGSLRKGDVLQWRHYNSKART